MKNMEDHQAMIWYDGQLVDWEQAKTHVLTHTLHYGMGVFEGLRVYLTDRGSAIFRLHDHTKRLFNSAKIVQMQLPYSIDEVLTAQKEVARRSQLPECYIRPMAFYGSKQLGVMPDESDVHLIIAAWQWGTYLGKEALQKGVKTKISSFCRQQSNSMMCKAKANGNYLNSIYAKKEAVREGYDEAILLDHLGYLAEGTGENLFIVIDGKVHTPSLTSALAGITRATVIELLNEFDIPVIERTITRDELYIADEVFFTGTAAEITPVAQVDGRIIGDAKPRPITERLQQAYFDIVHGRNKRYHSWLTFLDQ